MLNFLTLDAVASVVGFLVPGLVASFIRSQFTTGRMPPPSEAALAYLAVSLVYYALAYPILGWVIRTPSGTIENSASWFSLVFIGPAILGLALGLNARHEWFRAVLRKIGCTPVHHIQTSWDWRFAKAAAYVLVRLTDGSTIAGLCSEDSFASSSPGERDIYLQETFDITEDKQWIQRSNTILIASGQIATIEFWPYTENKK